MKTATKEPWWELAEQAAVEKDPTRLLQLMAEINRLLAEKRDREIPEEKMPRF
jgi:hypothetical protein